MKKQKVGKRILSVTIKRMLDDSPDTSWQGEYSDSPSSPYSIDRATDEFYGDFETGTDWLDRIQTRVEEEQAEMPCDCAERSWYGKEHDTACPSFQNNDWYLALESALETISDTRGEFGACWNRHEYRYFNPSFNYVDKAGNALPENTPEQVREYVRQDYKRMETLNSGWWYFIGIRAEAEIGIEGNEPSRRYHFEGWTFQTITSGGLWGIESDSNQEYFDSVEKEELADLKTQLLALGFGKRAVSTAFKNVERKDA